MPKLLTLRPLTGEEEAAVDRLTRSRTAAARAVERARIVWLVHHGRRVPAAAREVGASEQTVRRWLTRFNERGLDGLRDAARVLLAHTEARFHTPDRPAIRLRPDFCQSAKWSVRQVVVGYGVAAGGAPCRSC